MQEPTIDPGKLEVWARFLLEHSLDGIEPADRVMIKGEGICWPLMEVLERLVIEAGAVPDVCLIPPNNDRGRVWSSAMGRAGGPEQIERTPQWHEQRYLSMTKYIEVLGAEDPQAYTGLSSDQVRALAVADQSYSAIRQAKPWVLTLYPTSGFAAMEGMDLSAYTDFVVQASTTDPRPLKQAEEALVPLFNQARAISLLTHHPGEDRSLRLDMNLEHSRPTISYGKRNFPDGEIYTSPDARSVQGEIFVDLPVHYSGKDIQGIYLRFEQGVIVSYQADQGHEQLSAIIESDDGSHRLGEVALGMNPGLSRVLKHPLFVEKVGGTAHIAIGNSYANCFVQDPSSAEGEKKLAALKEEQIFNTSAQHVDIVTDFREGGCGRKVLLDDQELTIRDGLWVVP